MTVSRWFAALRAVLCTVFALASLASAQELVIGSTSGFTGPAAGPVKELTAGALLYFDHINAQGGIAGRKLRLQAEDDAFDPKRSAENARKLVTEHKVVALFLTRGTPHTQAMLPIARESGTPIVAPSTGAAVFHEPVDPLIFNVRSKYQTEAEKAVVQLATVGIDRIAVVHVDDSFGKDSLAGYQKGFTAARLKPLQVLTYDRTKPDIDAVVSRLVALKPQAVVTAGSPRQLADLIKGARKAGAGIQFVALSNVSSRSFIEDLGEAGHGVQVMQVFPNPALATYAITQEMQRLARGKPSFVISHAAMEGFAAAKVLVEGLRRAGKSPTRESLVAALNTLGDFDLGGIKVSYSAADHTGIDFAEPSIIGRKGEFIQR
jgi:ABC-type branched-subunit amino acid transport system substrate-binding protein